MKTRNPYDSLKVLRAVIQDIMEQVSSASAYDSGLAIPTESWYQGVADLICGRLHFRGVPLLKQIGINVRFDENPAGIGLLDFTLTPLSEDGKVLLQLLLKEDESQKPLSVSESPSSKPKVRRIVEI